MAQPTLLVREIAEQTDGFPAGHTVHAFCCLIDSLRCAEYDDFAISGDDALGPAIECSYRGVRHVVLVLLLDHPRYDLTVHELDDYVKSLLSESNDRESLMREVGDACLDVASVCVDHKTKHLSIHHLVDVLHTQIKRPKDQRFLIPRGSARPIRIFDDLYAGRSDGAQSYLL